MHALHRIFCVFLSCKICFIGHFLVKYLTCMWTLNNVFSLEYISYLEFKGIYPEIGRESQIGDFFVDTNISNFSLWHSLTATFIGAGITRNIVTHLWIHVIDCHSEIYANMWYFYLKCAQAVTPIGIKFYKNKMVILESEISSFFQFYFFRLLWL